MMAWPRDGSLPPGHMLSVRGTSRGDCIRRVAPRFEEQAGDRDRDNRRHRGAGHNLPEQTDYMLRTYPPTSEDWATVLVVLNLDMDGRRRDAASLCHRDPACRPLVLCRRGVCAGRPQAARRYLKRFAKYPAGGGGHSKLIYEHSRRRVLRKALLAAYRGSNVMERRVFG